MHTCDISTIRFECFFSSGTRVISIIYYVIVILAVAVLLLQLLVIS